MLLILSVEPLCGMYFLCPGTLHHTCWMLKIIYYIKLYMFSWQLESTQQCIKLMRMATFMSLLYTVAWLKSPVVKGAPVNDLQLHHELCYRAMDCEVADAAVVVTRRHLWCLRPQMIVTLLCSEKPSAAYKRGDGNQAELSGRNRQPHSGLSSWHAQCHRSLNPARTRWWP